MSVSNMETAATASLERSLLNCSISSASQQQTRALDADGETLQLKSPLSLPSPWEPCLDLKKGEIYYINQRNGMKIKEEPREAAERIEKEEDDAEKSDISSSHSEDDFSNDEQVLVVAGCKNCLMYFMLPKTSDQCPKCSSSFLLHFARHEN